MGPLLVFGHNGAHIINFLCCLCMEPNQDSKLTIYMYEKQLLAASNCLLLLITCCMKVSLIIIHLLY